MDYDKKYIDIKIKFLRTENGMEIKIDGEGIQVSVHP